MLMIFQASDRQAAKKVDEKLELVETVDSSTEHENEQKGSRYPTSSRTVIPVVPEPAVSDKQGEYLVKAYQHDFRLGNTSEIQRSLCRF